MKHPRDQEEAVSLALSLSTDSAAAGSSSENSAGSPPAANKRARRRGPVVATSGEGDFVCKTCNRAFTSFQALGGHRTSHLRGRHGLELGVGAKALRQHKQAAAVADKDKQQQTHECHICGLGFEMGQALGGHMRRHREEMGAAEAADAWVWRPEELLLDDLADVRRRDPPLPALLLPESPSSIVLLKFLRPPSSLSISVPLPLAQTMKHPRDAAGDVALSLALSLSLGGLPADRHGAAKKQRRAGGDGEFVCKTCSRAFASFQALGGHRTSHLRGRHGLALAVPAAKPPRHAGGKDDGHKQAAAAHQCHVCGVEFEMGQALGGHMRRHREEAAAQAQAPPVLLQLF
ncbi:hypothetical protein U9M48_010987, partial [Paspalum notatum var. saurae]